MKRKKKFTGHNIIIWNLLVLSQLSSYDFGMKYHVKEKVIVKNESSAAAN